MAIQHTTVGAGPSSWLTSGTLVWSAILTALLSMLWLYREGVSAMVASWSRDEYSYAYFLPPLVAFFIWQKKNELLEIGLRGSWVGFAVVLLAVGLYVAGNLATLYVVVQYGFIVAVIGAALALLGYLGFRLVLAPLAMLFFLVPLPAFLFNNLSQSLQLLSSQWGVWVLRLFQVPVFEEGNVIHLAEMRLQVVEACSGLRYLFPLMAIGLIVAYLYRAAFWKRALLFLSTIPITVVMNSLRIGLIGVAVEYGGRAQAEGLLHAFEGWVVFMASLGVLLFEMWVLGHIGGERRPFREVFGFDFPAPTPPELAKRPLRLPAPFIATLVLLLAAGIAAAALPSREEVAPARPRLSGLPMQIGDWHGRSERLDRIYIDALKLDDYVIAEYTGPAGAPVELYVAYYASQRKGASVHSPRTCIPGGGWEIRSLEQRAIPGVTVAGQPLRVNRVQIQKGDQRQLVYYWFQQRGRVVTNEYLLKWYLFWDALTRNRTDGALVRLSTAVAAGENLDQADRKLVAFAKVVEQPLRRFIPE